MAGETITYDRSELRDILKAFKAMDEAAVDEARTQSSALRTDGAPGGVVPRHSRERAIHSMIFSRGHPLR